MSHCVPPRYPEPRSFGMTDVPDLFYKPRGAVPISIRAEGRTLIGQGTRECRLNIAKGHWAGGCMLRWCP